MERNCILPDDLVEDIFSKLPTRDLLRCRSVSKEWCALIDKPSFIKKHFLVQYSNCIADGNMQHFVFSFHDDGSFLLSIQQGEVITLNLNADLDRDMKAVLPYGLDRFRVHCYGCVNGIICLRCESKRKSLINTGSLALWNPAIREFKIVAFPNVPGMCYDVDFEICAFGFDPLSNDFKILGKCRVRREGYTTILYYKLYSLKANSWKSVNEPVNGLYPGTDGYLNGVYYWISYFEEENEWFVIESFNFSSEVFKVSDPPQDVKSRVLSCPHSGHSLITLYKEHLALFICHKVKEEAFFNIDIWVVTQFDDCGAPLSWQHLSTIIPHIHAESCKVATTLKDGDLLLDFMIPSDNTSGEEPEDFYRSKTYKEGEVYVYNPVTGEFKKSLLDFHSYFRYIESLFPLSKRLVQM